MFEFYSHFLSFHCMQILAQNNSRISVCCNFYLQIVYLVFTDNPELTKQLNIWWKPTSGKSKEESLLIYFVRNKMPGSIWTVRVNLENEKLFAAISAEFCRLFHQLQLVQSTENSYSVFLLFLISPVTYYSLFSGVQWLRQPKLNNLFIGNKWKKKLAHLKSGGLISSLKWCLCQTSKF